MPKIKDNKFRAIKWIEKDTYETDFKYKRFWENTVDLQRESPDYCIYFLYKYIWLKRNLQLSPLHGYIYDFSVNDFNGKNPIISGTK